ncbi:uncharacterized protein [Prorops nasuta]|uniref:uncharacterized protein isoform X2 n=1 Tax=Prorops nasuta TaxID=863751 RepID=UPI0034CFFCC2
MDAECSGKVRKNGEKNCSDGFQSEDKISLTDSDDSGYTEVPVDVGVKLTESDVDRFLRTTRTGEGLPGDFEKLAVAEQKQCILEKLKKDLPEVANVLPDNLLDMVPAFFRPGDCGRPQMQKPDWLDVAKFQSGQQFAQNYLGPISLSEMLSLFLVFSFDNGLKPLIITNQSDTLYKSYKRYLSTTLRLMNWYQEDPWMEGSSAFKDIQNVRRMHMAIRKKLERMGVEQMDRESTIERAYCPWKNITVEDFQEAIPEPLEGQCPFVNCNANIIGMNQGDMAITQFSFVGLFLVHPAAFGVHYATDEQLEAFCHLWRSIGFLLGIEDEYNFCRGTLREVQERTRNLIEYWVKPNLRLITPEWEHMMRCLIEGTHYYFPAINYEAAILYLAEILNIDAPRLYAAQPYLKWFKYSSMRIPYMLSLLTRFMKESVKRAENYPPEIDAVIKAHSDRKMAYLPDML